jgi:four helix bundle protein
LSHGHQDLIVWQRAKAFASDVYRVTEGFPNVEIYGLTSQRRRAAVSVASNIAEGQGRLTRGEFCHPLGQARGSLLALETQLAIAVDLHLPAQAEFKELEEKILRSPKMTEPPKRIDPSAQNWKRVVSGRAVALAPHQT